MRMNIIKSLLISGNKGTLFTRGSIINFPRLSSTGSYVGITKDEKTRTATLVLQRAPVNSLNAELLQQISASIRELEKNKFRGLIITSSCPTIFSAGLDIYEMYKPEEKRFREFWKSLQEFFKTLYVTPLVTVAAINGHAPAGGCLMGLCCDSRVMIGGNATIGLNEVQLGIAAPRWFRSVFINNIGYRQAEKALLLGTLFKPQEALSLGIVDELANDHDDLLSRAGVHLNKLMKIPSMAYQATKIGLRKPLVNELKTYEEQEVNILSEFVKMDFVQNTLEKYIEALKVKKA